MSRKVTALRDFYDEAEKVTRREGEEFEASEERIAQLNACGRKQCFQKLVREHRTGRPTKAELLDEAAVLGVEVPEGATNPEIYKLIAERKGE
ncbi:MAG: hypothetical protein IJ092_06310 [Atopobiaceae bacterium]|nr:hypothetical protein [Atopobiaceae bacterium]